MPRCRPRGKRMLQNWYSALLQTDLPATSRLARDAAPPCTLRTPEKNNRPLLAAQVRGILLRARFPMQQTQHREANIYPWTDNDTAGIPGTQGTAVFSGVSQLVVALTKGQTSRSLVRDPHERPSQVHRLFTLCRSMAAQWSIPASSCRIREFEPHRRLESVPTPRVTILFYV